MTWLVAMKFVSLGGILLVTPNAVATPTTMQAVVVTGASKEGDFSKVKLLPDQPVPSPGYGQLLIRVAYSSVNPIDFKIMSWNSLSVATLLGPRVAGFDVSGIVEEVGWGCDRMKKGDEVWADLGIMSLRHFPLQWGAWAEYAVAECSQTGLKPKSIDMQLAGSLPLVSLTDYQALKMAGSPWAGRKNLTVVVTSGTGGTGMPAIQLAKAYGATRIITAASPSNAGLLKSLGATDVIDFHKSTIWDVLPPDSVDIVYDNYGAAGTADTAMSAIRSGGAFVFLPGKGAVISKNPKEGVKQIDYGLCDASKHEDLDDLAKLIDEGHLKMTVIQETYALEDINKALTMLVSGHVDGKISLNISKNASFTSEEPSLQHALVV